MLNATVFDVYQSKFGSEKLDYFAFQSPQSNDVRNVAMKAL